MRFRSHINFAVLLAGGVFYSLMSVQTPSLPSLLRDIPASLLFILIGAGIVDMDIWWKGRGHRMNSLFHTLEAPFVFGAPFLAFSLWPGLIPASWRFLPQILFLLCVGWAFHLAGDFIEGGIRSAVLNRKVGITWLKWKRYDGTFIGRALDCLTYAGPVIVIAWVFLKADAERVGLIPSLLNKLFLWQLDPKTGIFFPFVIWGICISWGRGGFKGFFWRIVFAGAGVILSWWAFIFLLPEVFSGKNTFF